MKQVIILILQFSIIFSFFAVEGEEGEEGSDCSLFSFATIATATDNFSSSNKLGEGGFGPVYKVMLGLYRSWHINFGILHY